VTLYRAPEKAALAGLVIISAKYAKLIREQKDYH